MFNNSLEKNRYSLRKLSVGLASVLIGISFIEANGQTAKADTVNDGNTANVAKVEKTANDSSNAANNANGATKDANASNGSLDAASSTSAGQESLKENGSQNYGAKENAQATAAKTNAVKNDITGAKATIDAANGTQSANTNAPVANQSNTDSNKTQNAPSSVKQKGKSDTAQVVNNNILSTGTTTLLKDAQEPMNVAVDAKNASNTSTDTQTLNVIKNSKALDSKAIAANLTDDNSTQDISKISDPSKIDASHFLDGTHWTPAGWTRADKDTKTVKSSRLNISLTDNAPIDSSTGLHSYDPGNYIYAKVNDITFTVDKNDLKAGNKILVSTIQQTSTVQKQSALNPTLNPDSLAGTKYNIDYNNQSIGSLNVFMMDNSEIDVWLYVNKTINDAVSDPTFKVTIPSSNNGIVLNNQGHSFDDFYSYKNHLKYPLKYSVVTTSNILNYQIKPNNGVIEWSGNDHFTMAYDDGVWQYAGKQWRNDANQENIDNENHSFIFKITAIKGQNPHVYWMQNGYQFFVYDANGIKTNDIVTLHNDFSVTKMQDNLSNTALWNATPDGSASYSEQSDGSILVCNRNLPPKLTKDNIEKALDQSYLLNIQDPDHAQQIIQNTINHTKSFARGNSIFFLNVPLTNQAEIVTDVTPNSTGIKSLGTFTIKSTMTDTGQSSSDLETYKTVKISYIDDDATDPTKNVASSDSMTGRQNKASTYTVNIPKGYYLDDNNTSTGYTWNADHTAISYTFNEDQAKNDANPIEIHLKHIHSAVKDDKYLKNNSVRTITFNFPVGHGDPETITQTIGWTRTGTYDEVTAAAKGLDEAEKEGNYTDWTFTSDPAATKVTVTVNGKDDSTLASKYQAYDQQAYAKDNSNVEFAAIPIPKIPGYKAQFVQDKANPAMFLVSFMAMPNTDASKDDSDVTPVKPANPSDETTPEVPVTPSDPKSSVDITIPDEPEAPTVPVDTTNTDVDVITMEKPAEAPVNVEMHVADIAWHIKDETSDTANYTVVNTAHQLALPRFNGYTLRLVKHDTAKDAVSFIYVNPNKTLKYIFNIKLVNGKYILTIGKVTEDGIMQLEKVTFSDYNQLMQLIAKAVNK